MNKQYIYDLSEKIKLPESALNIAISAYENNMNTVENIVNKSSLDNIRLFSSEIKKDRQRGAAIALAASLIISEKALDIYREKEIPDSIFFDTMSDITIWVNTAMREENICGLINIPWLRHSLYLNLFKIGRLQYQFYKTDYIPSGLRLLQLIKAPIKNKEKVLNIHIPEGEKLVLEDCVKSVEAARHFFKQYYPEYSFKGFVCDSWLLDSNNALFMDKASNIVRFSELFDTVYKTRSRNDEMGKRVWGEKTYDKNNVNILCENTDLQKRAKKYLLSGGKTGNGYGFIL